MLIGGDDRRGNFGALQQLVIIRSHEIGAYLLRNELRAIGLDLGQTDEVDLRVPRRDFAAEEPDATGADDREADSLGRLTQRRGATA